MYSNSFMLDNVRIVREDEVINGHIIVENGVITALDSGRLTQPGTIDGGGGYLLPGFVELHTDNMDKCFVPRPKTQWPAMTAMQLHDNTMALSGITTVCDAVAIGYIFDGGDRAENVARMVNAIIDGEKQGVHRVAHYLHLRCELPSPKTVELFEQFKALEQLRLVSLMDHAPGQRQFVSLQKFRQYYQGKYNLTNAAMSDFEQEQVALSERWSEPNRAKIAAHCRAHGIVLASHDDGTLAHVQEALAHGCAIAEFPTTVEAATASHQKGMCVVMGAPNVVRGGSHSGNIAAHELASDGVLDILSSDYYPSSLVEAIFMLAARTDNDLTLCDTVKMISTKPAKVLGFSDRGVIALQKRADLVLVRMHHDSPLIEQVWSRGRRVH